MVNEKTGAVNPNMDGRHQTLTRSPSSPKPTFKFLKRISSRLTLSERKVNRGPRISISPEPPELQEGSFSPLSSSSKTAQRHSQNPLDAVVLAHLNLVSNPGRPVHPLQHLSSSSSVPSVVSDTLTSTEGSVSSPAHSVHGDASRTTLIPHIMPSHAIVAPTAPSTEPLARLPKISVINPPYSLQYTRLSLALDSQIANVKSGQYPPRRKVWKMIGGRRYHDITGICYPLPCDEDEAARLFMQHHLLRLVLQGNYIVPIKDTLENRNALDVGCGTGVWVQEMAAEFTKAHFVGVDIAESYFPVPPHAQSNMSFQYANLLNDLPFEDETFHFVHMRQMMTAILDEKWNGIVSRLLRILEPDGWIQLLEMDPFLGNSGPRTCAFLKRTIHALTARGIDTMVSMRLEDLLTEAGFVHVQSSVFHVPMGEWGGRIGERTSVNFIHALKNMAGLILPAMGMNDKEFEEEVDAMKSEFATYETVLEIRVAWAQRNRKVMKDNSCIYDLSSPSPDHVVR